MAEDEKRFCYSVGNNCLLTLFETGGQDAHLLPHSGLLAARFDRSNGEQLTLVYVTHTVVIKGVNLKVLIEPIQQASLKSLSIGEIKTGNKDQKLAIRSIEVSLGSQPECSESGPEVSKEGLSSVDTIS